MVLSNLATAIGVLGPSALVSGDAVAVARISKNMRHAAFTEDEIARFLKALYLTGTKKDSREAWSVLDRRRTGTIARHEVEDALCDILGDECRRKISQLLNRLPSHGNAYAMNESVQMVKASEFADMIDALAQLGRGESLPGYLARETSAWLSDATNGIADASRAWTSLELDVLAVVPPPLLPRAGAVVQRFLDAGYTTNDASTAVAGLYGPRDTRGLARLWGLFDVERSGVISGATFDSAICLLTDAINPADVPAIRQQMGFVHAESVTINEFEAALRVIIPQDGSAPKLSGEDAADLNLYELIGGQANALRLKPFQRQRVSRVAHRMKNFGYSRQSITSLCKTLFLTKLHDRDLWTIWTMLHPQESQGGLGAALSAVGLSQQQNDHQPSQTKVTKGGSQLSGMEAPLDVSKVRHLLALLSETNAREGLDSLVQRIDANQSGDVEFEELATLIRAVNPQLARPKDLSEVEFEAHPLLEQVCVQQQQIIATHTHAQHPPFLSLTPLLSSLLLLCRSRRLPTTQKASL